MSSEGAEPSAPVGAQVLRLISIMDRLRSPGGCPWDAEQTHESLVQYLVEETYETIEAIDSQDRDDLIEELGDLLLQIVFHARIGQEADQPWSIDDVATGISDKLIRRHPHVFAAPSNEAAPEIKDAATSERAWQLLKAAEKGRSSVTDGVPMGMPPLTLAAKLMRRAERGEVAVEVTDPQVVADVSQLLGAQPTSERIGEVLIALVGQAERNGIDADAALRHEVQRFRQRIIDSEG